MSATLNIKIIIIDCRQCTDWPAIQPLLWDLFREAAHFNQARKSLLENMDPEQSGIWKMQTIDISRRVKLVRACLARLRKHGVHFLDSQNLDIFCDAFTQAMVNEFGEATLDVAVY